MSALRNEYVQAAIERRQRLKMAGLKQQAKLFVDTRPKLVVVEPPLPPHVNNTPDELMNARRYVRKYPTTTEIIEAASRRFGIPAHDIMSQRRTNEIIFARHAIYWLCRECTPMSLLQIGHLLGKRDHTTILHGIRQTEDRIAANNPSEVAYNCLVLRDELKGPAPKPYWGA